MTSVFISHSSKDKEFVLKLAKALNEHGVMTWVDHRQIKVGQPIPRRIAEGISHSDFFLIVLSESAVASRWVESELNSAYFKAARQKADAILPVLLENVELPTLLCALKYADFSESFDEGFTELLRTLAIDKDELPFLTRTQRRTKIKAMLTSEDKFGQLPSEVIALVEDESYLDLFEDNIDIKTDRRVLTNSLYAIRFLAAGWDGRYIRRHLSIGPLLRLYRDADAVHDFQIRKGAVCALCEIDSVLTREFLIQHLGELEPESAAEILANWQDIHEWTDSAVWASKVLPLLHKFATLPPEQCLYFDLENIEQDLRFWAFRCLQKLKRKISRKCIEDFLSSVNYPLRTLVEAAMAHWCVTGTEKYVPILRRACRAGDSNAKYFLEQIQKVTAKKKRTKPLQ